MTFKLHRELQRHQSGKNTLCYNGIETQSTVSKGSKSRVSKYQQSRLQS